MAIKKYQTEPPVLTSPEAGETLFVYLAVSDVVVSVALFKENTKRRSRLVFFVSNSLADVETRYNHLEEAALALLMATKKLKKLLVSAKGKWVDELLRVLWAYRTTVRIPTTYLPSHIPMGGKL